MSQLSSSQSAAQSASQPSLRVTPQRPTQNGSQYLELLQNYLPRGIKAFIDGSSRRDLLRKINTTLVVFNNQVAHVESGRITEFQEQSHPIDAALLAQASKQLLGDTSGESSILLLLPPALFVATRQKLPGINKDNIVSALRLQTETLLPANTEPVSLAINPQAVELSAEATALWVRNQTLVEFFEAFAVEQMFVAAVQPRVLELNPASSHLLDEDDSTLTSIKLEQNVVTEWLQVAKQDLEQPEFATQWQEALTDETGKPVQVLSSIAHYVKCANTQALVDYVFFPQGALNARRQFEKGRKLMVAAGLAFAVMILASIPFLIQSFQFRSLAATLEAQRELSYEARQDQAVVVNFENELGPVNDFPDQRVRDAMFTLQNVLSPNQLSSLEVAKGQITIQGTSTEPQSILQRLEMDPMFTEVAFSRATNNDRYYIGLRLSTVNFDAYMVRYFPDE